MLSKFVFLSSLSSVNCLSLYIDGLVSGHRSWLFTESVLTSSRGKDRGSSRDSVRAGGTRNANVSETETAQLQSLLRGSRSRTVPIQLTHDTALDDEYFIKKQRR
jgi:hypothetical protein